VNREHCERLIKIHFTVCAEEVLVPRLENRGAFQMAVIAKAISQATGIDLDVETLKTIVMFSAVGLTVSLMCASYGLDLSPGFF
jgi:hypothetical protein